MKRIWGSALMLLCTAALMLAGCAPTEETEVKRGPDMSQKENVKLDFVQLHNDTIDAFGDAEDNPYVFISDVNVSGDNDKKTISIDAVCLDDTTKEEAEQFAAAAVRHANDATVTQSTEFEQSSQQSFGNLFDKYALTLTVRPEGTKDDSSTYLVNLKLSPGEEIPLNPDIETYEESWRDTRDEYLEQLQEQPLEEESPAAGTDGEAQNSKVQNGEVQNSEVQNSKVQNSEAETKDTQTSVD